MSGRTFTTRKTHRGKRQRLRDATVFLLSPLPAGAFTARSLRSTQWQERSWLHLHRLHLGVNGERGHAQLSEISSLEPTDFELGVTEPRRTYESVDIEDVVDPEFSARKPNENYDNDFDARAFVVAPSLAILSHSCAVDYEFNGLAIPYMTSLSSESTWIEYAEDGGVVSPAGPVGQYKEMVANFSKEPRVEIAISFAVLISCALVAVSTFENMPFQEEFYLIENFISAVFAVDFFGRWFSSSKDRGRHVLDPQFALDTCVVLIPLLFCLVPNIGMLGLPLPEWMTSPSALINLEVLRVLRLRRVLRDMDTFVKYERALGIRKSNIQEWQLQLARVLLSLFTLLSVSTGLIYTAEHDVNPAIPDFFTAAYFALSTISTLGIGDITPMTWQGRLVVCGSILAGVAILPAQAANLVEALVARRESLADQRTSRFRRRTPPRDNDTDASRMVLETTYTCPRCGSSMHWSTARFCWSCGESLPSRE